VKKNGYALVVPAVYIFSATAAFISNYFNYPPYLLFASIWILFFVLLWIKKKGFNEAVRTLYLWHFFALAAIVGLVRPIKDPLQRIDSVEIGTVEALNQA
jgi:hypothetical protein